MHTNCSLPESNKMFCLLEERERGWNLSEEFDFSKVHMRVVCIHLHLLTPACLKLFFFFSLHLLFSVCTFFFSVCSCFALSVCLVSAVCIYFRLIFSSHFIPFSSCCVFPVFFNLALFSSQYCFLICSNVYNFALFCYYCVPFFFNPAWIYPLWLLFCLNFA